MSASAKKKLRKEENAAQLTEKQLQEQKEAKKLKLVTSIFVVAIAVVLVAGLAIAGTNFYKNSGFVEKRTVAAVVGDNEINAVELSYYYNDLINSNVSNWSATYGENMQFYMSMMGLDMSKPLDEQSYSGEITWADYFLELTMQNIESDYLLSEKAEAEGFTLSEDALAQLEANRDQLSAYAAVYGFPNVESYMRSAYGPGADLETYFEYTCKTSLAKEFYNNYAKNLPIDDAAIRAYEKDNFSNYSSFAYASHTISYSDYLTGGTTDENGVVTYTDAEKADARAAAKAAAEAFPQCSTVEELNAAIAALNPEKECSVYTNVLFENLVTSAQTWMADSNRKVGDFTVIANETITTDENGAETTEINSYTAYLFTGRNDNTMPLANIRHALFGFTGGTADETGKIVYSDESKAEALQKAENMLQMYEMTAMTEEDFASLVTANTTDYATAETGGLYEDITPEKGIYTDAFTNWATDPARFAGETGIIESEYGYHVMYYVGDDELTYRDYMISNDIRTEKVDAWYAEIMNSGELVKKDTSRLRTDMILTGGNV